MTPRLVFVIGPAGSGKSTVSTQIARHLHAAYLDKDSVATAFTETLLEAAGADKHERDNNSYYQGIIMGLEYETLLRIAGDNLRLGNTVVLDAPFVRYFADETYLQRAAASHSWPADVHVTVVHVTVDGAKARDRIGNRGFDRDAWKLDHWDEFWATAQAAECRWRGAHHVLFDNSSSTRGPDVEAALAELL